MGSHEIDLRWALSPALAHRTSCRFAGTSVLQLVWHVFCLTINAPSYESRSFSVLLICISGEETRGVLKANRQEVLNDIFSCRVEKLVGRKLEDLRVSQLKQFKPILTDPEPFGQLA